MRIPARAAATVLLALIATLGLQATSATAKTYSADRFDCRVRLLPGGALEVTETVLFRLESGTFDHVFREISVRRIDGLEIVGASMDGRVFPLGSRVYQLEVTGSSKKRIVWHFQPLADFTHTFVLTYILRGIVRQEDGADVLLWRALPSEHQYRIDSSTVELELPGSIATGTAPLPAPRMEWHRIEGAVAAGITRSGADVPAAPIVARATAQGIRPNGWMEVRLDLPPGSVVTTAPQWQQKAAAARALAPRWITAAGLIVFAGLILLFGQRQQYDGPPRETSNVGASAVPPDTLAPGLVGPLLSNGRTTLEHAMAAVLSLAERGIVAIEEQPRSLFGQRTFALRKRKASGALASHETTLLAMIFNDGNSETVPLGTARRRLVRRFRQFTAAVQHDLQAAGLIDADRKRIRDRYARMAVALLILAGLAFVPALVFADVYAGWTLLVPAAIMVVAVTATICAAATTPLSNEAVHRAARWRGFRNYLKAVTHNQETPAPASLERLLPLAVATGQAAAWARFLKRHPGSVPPWFRALSAASQDSAFTAFVTASAASHGAGAGAGGGGAAGGGASGAG